MVGRLGADVGDLNSLLSRQYAPEAGTGMSLQDRIAPALLDESGRAMHRHGAKRLPFGLKHDAELRAADTGRVRQHGLEHWCQFARRAGDDAKYLGGRSLLL